jgi:hypothetical protein
LNFLFSILLLLSYIGDSLLFPFVPESQFDAAASLLRDAVRGSACTVELTHFKAFPHGNVHIEPRVSVRRSQLSQKKYSFAISQFLFALHAARRCAAAFV